MTKRLLFAAGVTLALVGCSRVDRELDAARELTLKRDFKAAAAQYQSALIDLGRDESDHARDARALTLRALGDLYYLHLGDYAEAARVYRDLAERYPERPEAFDARAHLADILQDRFHDTRAALAQLAALVQSFPNHLDTDRFQYKAAQDYFALRDYAQTETELRLLLQRYPGSGVKTDAQMLLAGAMAMQGRKQEAIDVYAQIAREHPGADAGRANLEIGRLYEDSGDYDKAENSLARALADHPDPQLVAMALQRVRRRVALKRPEHIGDHAAIFAHKPQQGMRVAQSGD